MDRTLFPYPLDRPIGVFDSGVGGLTVLQALRRALPHRDFIYLGDTARVPYGRKPPEMVAGFAYGITAFLLEAGAEGVVIACNTASSAALPELASKFPVPIWGVIEPGVEAAVRLTRNGLVGVIGTKGAIASRAYQRRLEQRGFTVWARACPMLVHIVEEGLAESPECALLLDHYLAGREPIDTLILGCTHYPLLREAIQRAVGDAVTLVDSAEVVAAMVRDGIGDDRPNPRRGRVVHFVTGDPVAFAHTAAVIGEVDGQVVPLPVTGLMALERRAELAAAGPHPSSLPDR